MKPNERAPTTHDGRDFESANRAGLQNDYNPQADILLNRLENVRQYGQGWRAKCPAHDGKSPGSLSIAVGDDQRILLHCFGGCSALDVVHSCGLELSDLFEKRLMHNATPAERRVLRELARQCQWKAAVPALMSESIVVLMAAGKIDKGEPLTPADDDRLMLAIERIESAKAVFCGR